MSKNIYLRLVLISLVAAFSFLVALPSIPIYMDNSFLRVNSHIGGYKIKLFANGKGKDLTTFKKGVDIAGGYKIFFTPNFANIEESAISDTLSQTLQVLQTRLFLLNVTEPNIYATQDQLVIEVPSEVDLDRVISVLRDPARLNFKQLKADQEWSIEKYEDFYYNPEAWEDTGLTQADLYGAQVLKNTDTQKTPARIRLNLNQVGLQKLGTVALQNINKPLAIYIDNVKTPIAVTLIDETFLSGALGDPIISGSLNQNQAEILSLQIRSGALPLSFSNITHEDIPAVFGENILETLSIVGVLFLILLIIYMTLTYKLFGFISVFSYFLNVVLILALIKFFEVVLTLSSIGGLILGLVILLDTTILVLDRIKEEIYWEKPKNIAIAHSFKRVTKHTNKILIILIGLMFVLQNYLGLYIQSFNVVLSVSLLVVLYNLNFNHKTLLEVFAAEKIKLKRRK